MPVMLEAMRPHQWVKNLLLAVPLLTSFAWSEPGILTRLALAFVAFCAVASGNYLVNDVLDLGADRAHPARSKRPLASGRLQTGSALLLAVGLIAGGGLVGWTVNPVFLVFLSAYLGLALLYTAWLKRLLVLDVMSLAALYVLRLLAGGAAVQVEVSSWLMIFGMFLFVSLAFAKRLTELEQPHGGAAAARRAYLPEDRAAFTTVGPAAGLVAILVLAFYVSSDDIRIRYANPDFLWLLCPVLLYWITRIWFIALRGRLNYDPLVFAIQDTASWISAACVVAVFTAAIL